MKNSLQTRPMEAYIGKNLNIKTINGDVEGIMESINTESGLMSILNQNTRKIIKFDDVTSIELLQSNNPLPEQDMYGVFYEAFNVFGPSEDHFILTVASSLKKFLRDFSASSIRIVIGSDDVFGRIGLCFARIALGRTEKLSVILACNLSEIKSITYKSFYENSGGIFTTGIGESNYSLTLFACNRNFKFNEYAVSSGQNIILDLPGTMPFQNFTGLGLGFVPEHSNVCSKFFYLLDVGFGNQICKKYGLPTKFKNSLVKVEVNNPQ